MSTTVTEAIDRAAIEAAIQLYIDGGSTGDAEKLREAFHESGWMYEGEPLNGDLGPLETTSKEIVARARSEDVNLLQRDESPPPDMRRTNAVSSWPATGVPTSTLSRVSSQRTSLRLLGSPPHSITVIVSGPPKWTTGASRGRSANGTDPSRTWDCL